MEKTSTLVAGIEGFDNTKLKKTETNEKNPLPDKDGELFDLIISIMHFQTSCKLHGCDKGTNCKLNSCMILASG